MTPQELKNSILDRAFKGTLVNQISHDLSVETIELDNPPFDIPETWGWQKFGKICNLYTGNSINANEKKLKYEGLNNGYDYIGTKDVSFSQDIKYDNGVRIPFDTNFKIAPKDSIIMCIEGGSAGRKLGVLDRDVCFGNKLCVFNSKRVINKFIFYFLQSPLFQREFSSNMSGIIGGVSIRKLKDMIFPIPPIDEQEMIIEKIEELLPLVDDYEKNWQKLEDLNKKFPEDMKKSLLQEAIKGKLVEQRPKEGTGEDLYELIQEEKNKLIQEGKIKKQKALPEIKEDEIPFEIPESWKWVKLGNIGTLTRGSGIKRDEIIESEFPCIRYGELYTTYKTSFKETVSFTSKEVFQKSKKITKNDVLLTLTGENKIDIAKAVTYLGEDEIAMGGDMSTWSNHFCNSLFLTYLINSPYVISEKTNRATGKIIVHISNDKLSSINIPLPPLQEQNRIIEKLEELLPLCDQLVQKQ